MRRASICTVGGVTFTLLFKGMFHFEGEGRGEGDNHHSVVRTLLDGGLGSNSSFLSTRTGKRSGRRDGTEREGQRGDGTLLDWMRKARKTKRSEQS